MDPLLLGSLLGFGFALSEEQVKQTQILESMRMYQTLQDIPEPQSVPERTGHQKALVEKASKALENRDYELALSLSERLLKLERSDPLYYVLRGDCRARLGRISAAIEDYDRSLDMNERTRLLPPYLETSLKISLGQLEEIQATISRSKQEPSLEEISRMLDEAKSRQAETPRTDELLVPDDLAEAHELAVSQFVGDKELLVSQFMQDRPREAVMLFDELNGASASSALERLVLYEICLDTLLKLTHNSFLIFNVDNCRLNLLFSQFAYAGTRNKEFKDSLHGEIGWLPQTLHYVATTRGFQIHDMPDFRESDILGGSMFQQDFSMPNAGVLAQTVEEMLLLVTADPRYVVRVESGKG